MKYEILGAMIFDIYMLCCNVNVMTSNETFQFYQQEATKLKRQIREIQNSNRLFG